MAAVCKKNNKTNSIKEKTNMIYVTKGYTIKEFDTQEKAIEYIQNDMANQQLRFEKVYDHQNNKMRIIVFQYFTLYTETYIIHENLDLRR